METRNREVLEIARSIASLAELFKDLSNMVIDQGTILDSVEYNLERTNTYLQDAEKDLVVATKYVTIAWDVTISLTGASLKVPKKHWPTEVYLSPLPHHHWAHPRAHFQATTACIDTSPRAKFDSGESNIRCGKFGRHRQGPQLNAAGHHVHVCYFFTAIILLHTLSIIC